MKPAAYRSVITDIKPFCRTGILHLDRESRRTRAKKVQAGIWTTGADPNVAARPLDRERIAYRPVIVNTEVRRIGRALRSSYGEIRGCGR